MKELMLGVVIVGGVTAAIQLVVLVKFMYLCSDVASMRRTQAGMAKRDLERTAKQ